MEYNIRNIRKEKNMSQEELSQKSGVSRITISALEAGMEKTTTTATLMKIAAALDVTVDRLFFTHGV